MVSQSVFAQLGQGGGGRNVRKERDIGTGTLSEPVQGRGVSHVWKAGERREFGKARSRTEGGDLCVKGK